MHGCPAATKGRHDDGFNEEQDVFGRGVVSADHGTLCGVERALEESTENGGLDVGPVVLGGGVEDAEVGVVELDGGVVREETAIKVGDVVCAEKAMFLAHGGEEDGELAVEAEGRGAIGGDEAAKCVAWQKTHRVCEEAED